VARAGPTVTNGPGDGSAGVNWFRLKQFAG
jgi:hypothetical protein